uniref:E4 n=1 Tax=Human papillomavirus type 214 TaxID=2060138 RepID=A0A2R4QL97_9PAPI|nr:E4 [Human papillomavirus type 214]CAD1814236.1 E4 [Human papillomavirus type 214]
MTLCLALLLLARRRTTSTGGRPSLPPIPEDPEGVEDGLGGAPIVQPPPRPPKPTHRPRIDDSDGDDTENVDPNDSGGDQNLLLALLRQWDKDIEALINTIQQDLRGYKLRLGIPQFY